MHHIKRQRLAADAEIDLQAVALENPLMRLRPALELRLPQIELLIGEMGVALHRHEFNLLAVAGFLAHHNRHVDPAAIIAFREVFVPVARSNHLEEIAVFEGVQRIEAFHLLQADDVGVCVGDRQCRHLPRIVGQRDRPRDLHLLVGRLALDIVELHRPVTPQFVAEPGKIEPAQQVFGIEGGNSEHLMFPVDLAPGP